MPDKLNDEQLKQILIDNPGLTPSQYERRFPVGRARVSEVYARYKEEIDGAVAQKEIEKPGSVLHNLPPAKEKIDGRQWFSNEDYTYNNATDTYVTFLRCAPKPIVMPGEMHRAMQRAYSDWDGSPATINEICRTFSFPRPWFIEYKKIHGWTHDKEPFTNEEIMEKDTNVLVEEALEMKRNVLFQRYEQAKWAEVKEDADKWRQLVHNQVNPFNFVMDRWKPTKEYGGLPKYNGDDEVFSLIVGASDWQIGLKAIAENFTHAGSWDIEIGRRVIENYLQQIEKDVKRLKVNWDKCHLFNLGDLPHGMRGTTEAGTYLTMDATRAQQYDAIFSLQTFFIEGLYRIFGSVEEVGVQGNHEGFDAYAISRALQERYKGINGISISLPLKMVTHKRIGNTLFILTHGKNPLGYKTKYPIGDSTARQAMIQTEVIGTLKNLWSEDPNNLKGLVQIVFIQGDNHHFFHVEKAFYEDMQFGSPVLGDAYEDASRLFKRPSQSCLLVSHSSGVKAPLRYYFDNFIAETRKK